MYQDFKFGVFIQRHGPRMFKALNSTFFEAKTSNSKLLTLWGMSQDVKMFDVEVWQSKNIQMEAFSIQAHDLRC